MSRHPPSAHPNNVWAFGNIPPMPSAVTMLRGEQQLAAAVILQAFHDATSAPRDNSSMTQTRVREAQSWLTSTSPRYRADRAFWCSMLDIPDEAVRATACNILQGAK